MDDGSALGFGLIGGKFEYHRPDCAVGGGWRIREPLPGWVIILVHTPSIDGVEDAIECGIGKVDPSIGRRPGLGDLHCITGWVFGCAVADVDPNDAEPCGGGGAAGDVDFGAIEPDIAEPLI